MANSYFKVSQAIAKGLNDVIAQRAKDWFSVENTGPVDTVVNKFYEIETTGKDFKVRAVPPEKGPDFEKGWTFVIDFPKESANNEQLRIAASSVLGRLSGASQHSTIDMYAPNAIIGSTNWIARALNQDLVKLGQPEIDATVKDTRSELAEDLARHEKRIEKQTASLGQADTINQVSQEAVLKLRQALQTIVDSASVSGYNEKRALLTPYMDPRETGAALGLDTDTNFSRNLSQAQWDGENPLSSKIIALLLDKDKQDPILNRSFDTMVKDILLQYTPAHDGTTDYYSSTRTFLQLLEGTVEKSADQRLDGKTIQEARDKIIFCAFHVIEKVLTEQIAANFKARLSKVPLDTIVADAKLDAIELPASVNRQAFNDIALNVAAALRDDYLNDGSLWVKTPVQSYGANPNKFREPFVELDSRLISPDPSEQPVRRGERLPYRDAWALTDYLQKSFGAAGQRQAETIAEQAKDALNVSLKTHLTV